MRKKDPRCEITEAVRTRLMLTVIYDAKEGSLAELLLPKSSELEEKHRLDKISFLKKNDDEGFNDLSKRLLKKLIDSMASLVPEFYKAVDRGNARKLKEVLDKGFPVNFVNSLTGGTALHSLAAGGARPAIRALLDYKDVNFISRDNKGRLPSEMAYLFGEDPALARLLGIKERKQAEEKGIKLTRRPPPEAKP